MVRARLCGIAAMALLVSGCVFANRPTPFDLQVSQLELQVQSLQTRVDRLSTARGMAGSGASLSTYEATDSSATDFSSTDKETSSMESRSGKVGFQARGAGTKLVRGAANVVTGWVEIPKRIYETSQRSDPFAGFTWGLVRGLGRGFVRTAGGAYEVITFPFPAPPHYRPIIQPEYVFLPDASS